MLGHLVISLLHYETAEVSTLKGEKAERKNIKVGAAQVRRGEYLVSIFCAPVALLAKRFSANWI